MFDQYDWDLGHREMVFGVWPPKWSSRNGCLTVFVCVWGVGVVCMIVKLVSE